MELSIATAPCQLVNDYIGSALDGLEKCQGLYDELKNRKQLIEEQLHRVSTVVPTAAVTAPVDKPQLVHQIESIKLSTLSLQSEVLDHMKSIEAPLSKLADMVKRVADIERCKSYLQCVDVIEQISCDIQSAVLTDNQDKALQCYGQLLHLLERLSMSQCSNLIGFLQDSIRYWHCQIKERLSKELNELMKEIGWPFVTVLAKVSVPNTGSSEDTKVKLERLFRQLLLVQLPSSMITPAKLHPLLSTLPNWKPILLPIELLMQPLRKRFQYHFYGTKQTNNLDKPEWFFTQLLAWTKDHADYLTDVIQPILWKAGFTFVNAKVNFMRGIQQIAMEKLISMIPELLPREHSFSHLIQEVLSFQSDMCVLHGYPVDEASCLHVLTAEEAFRKWLSIEKKFATEKMDSLTESPSAWQCHYKRELEDDDDSKAPECAENFITMLSSISERYRSIPYTICQLLFVQMQEEILEDYRIRLVQIKKELSPDCSQYRAILNTTHYIITVLREWADKPFFLKLQYYSMELAKKSRVPIVLLSLLSRNAAYKLPDPIDLSLLEDCTSLFDKSVQMFSYMEKEMIAQSVQHLITTLKPDLRLYADNHKSFWTALNHLRQKEEQQLMSLSDSACDLLLHLQSELSSADDLLHKHLFTRYWQQLAVNLDDLIFSQVVSVNYFSEGGAIQFNYDMARNLFPIFGKFSSKPESFMKKTKESCFLLTLKLGDALLLKSVLKEALHCLESGRSLQDPISAIQEQGVYKLTPEEAELVLSRRNDLLKE